MQFTRGLSLRSSPTASTEKSRANVCGEKDKTFRATLTRIADALGAISDALHTPNQSRGDSSATKGAKQTKRDWLTPTEAAEYLNVSPNTLRVFFQLEGLKHTKLSDKPRAQLRFKREWLDEFMATRAQELKF